MFKVNRMTFKRSVKKYFSTNERKSTNYNTDFVFLGDFRFQKVIEITHFVFQYVVSMYQFSLKTLSRIGKIYIRRQKV